MKNITISTVVALLLPIFMFGQGSFEETKKFITEQGYEFLTHESGYIKRGYGINVITEFKKGYTYLIAGYTTSKNVYSINLNIYDEEGNFFDRDTTTGIYPWMYFNPNVDYNDSDKQKNSKKMKVWIINDTARDPDVDYYCGYVIGYKEYNK